jgi:DNA-binding HxlR family transcriptional regulator
MTDERRNTVSCPMDFILRILMGPWTTYILYTLGEQGPQRFGELKRKVTGVSAKMLTERLRSLEQADLISRDYEPTIPPKVTYALTARGRELGGVLAQLSTLGSKWMHEDMARPPRVVQAAE